MTTSSTRDHLLAIGLQQMHSNGYTATGVKEILDLAGVPKGSFYHYFPSKEAFTEEVLLLYATAEGQRLQSILIDGKQPPLKRLRKYFEVLTAVYETSGPVAGCFLGNLSLEVADQNPRLQSLLSTAFSNWQQGITATLREAATQGDLPKALKPDDLAAYLLNSWEGALLRMKADKSHAALHNFLHYTFNVLLKK
jgi:TetR/AcrR family transcriptional regulator, transcriptional repressor for nem operon